MTFNGRQRDVCWRLISRCAERRVGLRERHSGENVANVARLEAWRRRTILLRHFCGVLPVQAGWRLTCMRLFSSLFNLPFFAGMLLLLLLKEEPTRSVERRNRSRCPAHACGNGLNT